MRQAETGEAVCDDVRQARLVLSGGRDEMP